MATPEIEHLRRIATPTRVARTVGKDFFGEEYRVHPWLLYVEKRILETLAKPGRRIIIINVPPQEGKTTLMMWLLFWWLGLNPRRQAIFVTYSEEYAGVWGGRVLDLMTRFGPQLFGTEVSRKFGALNNWKMSGNFGGLMSVGIMGGITGNPGDLIVIDDVIKTMEDAQSSTAKRKHIAEWDGSIKTRFQENTKVVITATRWAEDDLSGEVIRRSLEPGYAGPPVEVISIPALAEPSDDELYAMTDDDLAAWVDFLGRHYGEGLAGQHSQEFFEEIRDGGTDPFTWSALYQGKPSSRKGGMFPRENWRFYDPADTPPCPTKVRVWDLATTEGGGDWTVGTLMGRTADNRFVVLDVQRFQKNPAGVEAEVIRFAHSDGRMVKVKIEEEKGGSGRSLLDFYRRHRDLSGFTVEAAKAELNKTQRATPYSAEQNKGNVWLPSGAHWVPAFVDEHSKMMGDGRLPRHDDQIDTAAYALLELLGQVPSTLFIPGESGAFVSAVGDVEAAMERFLEQGSNGGYQVHREVAGLFGP